MEIPFDKILNLGGEIVIIALIAAFVLKVIPTWKEVRLSDNKAREKDAAAIGALANALTGLGSSQTQLGTVLNSIAVQQRQSIDSMKILQRVNASSNDNLTEAVQNLTEQAEILNHRVGRLEENDANGNS